MLAKSSLPRNVLDEKQGSHAIYQVIWLAFLAVLVFGMLYVILLLVRMLPPFASGTEALTEQARTFLARRDRGAAVPEITRAVVVTVAAIGVGAAVVVAGSGVAPRLIQGSNAASDPNSQASAGGASGNSGRSRKPATEQPITVNIPPIVIPPVDIPPITSSPINLVDVPPIDETRLTRMGTKIDELDQVLKDPEKGVWRKISNVESSLGTVESALGKKADETTVSDLQKIVIPDIQRQLTAFDQQAGLLKSTFFEKLDTIEGLRADSLERAQSLGRKNLFTRFTRLFGKDRYMVTERSYRALENLMTKKEPVKCSNDPNDTCQCKDNPDGGCIVSSFPDSKAQQILRNLEKIKNEEPRDEESLIKKLGGEVALGRWKSVVLGYTRLPN